MPSSTSQDQRHLKRIKLVQHLFAHTFDQDHFSEGKLPFEQALQPEIDCLLENLEKIDAQLCQHAPERPLSEINQVDLAILRVIVWEWMTKKTPYKVLIDEAVELAKELGSDSSPRFINGVLGKLLVEDEKLSQKPEKLETTALD